MPAESESTGPSDVRHPFWVETGQACASRPTHAWVYDTGRAAFQQPLSQCLRCYVACWIETGSEAVRPAQVVELAAEIRKIVIELDFILVTAYFRKVNRFVKSNFGLRRVQLKRAIPGAAIRVVEPAAQRVGVGEGGIDDLCVRYTGNQLERADGGQQATLGKRSFIGHVAERSEILELSGSIGKLLQ